MGLLNLGKDERNKGNGEKPKQIRQMEKLYQRGKLKVDEEEPEKIESAEIEKDGVITMETEKHQIQIVMPTK